MCFDGKLGGGAPQLDDPIAISALQHAVFCLRQAALIHIERVWEENLLTAEGRVMHEVAHRDASRKSRGVRRSSGLPLASKRLNISGIADVVEFESGPGGEIPFPIEYKRGRPKVHRADEVQLCAQGLCLEEMTGRVVPRGAIFYGETKRRVIVPLDGELRQLTEDTVSAFGAIILEGRTPRAVWKRSRCSACSLIEICRPRDMAKSALEFRQRSIVEVLEQETFGDEAFS